MFKKRKSSKSSASMERESTFTPQKLYEMRIDTVKPGYMHRVLNILSHTLPRLNTIYPPIGCFTTDTGNVNQVIQIYEYVTPLL